MVMYPQATVNMALCLSAIGILDQENARICGVSIAAIRHWRCGRRRNPHGISAKRRGNCPRCHGRQWTNRHMRTCWAFTSVMDTSHADGGACSCCRFPVATAGPGSSQRLGARCPPSCPSLGSSAFSDKDARRLRAPQSTGRASSRSTARGGSTPGKSSSGNGNPRSCRNIPVNSPGGSSIPMAGVALTGCGEGCLMATGGTSINATFLITSPPTFSGCAVRFSIGSASPGVSPGVTRYPWRGGRRWRGLMSSSGPKY